MSYRVGVRTGNLFTPVRTFSHLKKLETILNISKNFLGLFKNNHYTGNGLWTDNQTNGIIHRKKYHDKAFRNPGIQNQLLHQLKKFSLVWKCLVVLYMFHFKLENTKCAWIRNVYSIKNNSPTSSINDVKVDHSRYCQ